jgi:hypothetical protein
MIDTAEPAIAASVSLWCHLGNERRTVDHEMVAAGHPRLTFELDSFAANIPAHWTQNKNNERWFQGAAWAAGQAVACREVSAAPARGRGHHDWPEFSRYDCYTCHHKLSPPGARPLRGQRGLPLLDTSRWVGLDSLVTVLGPGRIIQPASTVVDGTVTCAMPRGHHDSLSLAEVNALLRDLSSPRRSVPGFIVAQQIAWSLADLTETRARLGGGASEELRAAVNRVFDGLQNPALYDPNRFVTDLASVHQALD